MPSGAASDELLDFAALTAKFVELLKVAEIKVSEVLTYQIKEVLKQNPVPNWAPEAPPQSAGSVSPFVSDIIKFVKVMHKNF